MALLPQWATIGVPCIVSNKDMSAPPSPPCGFFSSSERAVEIPGLDLLSYTISAFIVLILFVLFMLLQLFLLFEFFQSTFLLILFVFLNMASYYID